MKKVVCLFLLFALAVALPCAAEDISVVVNGGVIGFDQPPIIQNGRTLVPMYAIFASLGFEVEWDDGTIRVYDDGKNIMTLQINNKNMITDIDGDGKWDYTELEVAPQIVGSRTLVPVRAISESIGANVGWDGETKTVYISYDPDASVKIEEEDETSEPEDADESETSDYISEVVRLVNEIRAEAGLGTLTTNDTINKAASIRAEELTRTFSHYRPDGSICFTVMEDVGLDYWAVGENIAAGYFTPSAAVEGWMNSEGHRENILNGDFTVIGVGYNPDGHYWVQIFYNW